MSKIVPVVFASNNSYVPYIGVVIKSLILCSNVRNQYQVYVLYSQMENENIQKLEAMSEQIRTDKMYQRKGIHAKCDRF